MGDIIEMNWATETVEKIISQLPPRQYKLVKLKEVKYAKTFVTRIIPTGILKSQITILTTIFKGVIDPRCFDYLEINNIYNLFAIAFSYLWNLEFKQLALLLTCSTDSSIDNDVIYINSTVNISHISKELKDELDIMFPYMRIAKSEKKDKSKLINLAEETIGEVVDEFHNTKLVITAPPELTEEVIGKKGVRGLLTSDIKNMLASFIVKNERMVYNG